MSKIESIFESAEQTAQEMRVLIEEKLKRTGSTVMNVYTEKQPDDPLMRAEDGSIEPVPENLKELFRRVAVSRVFVLLDEYFKQNPQLDPPEE